MFRKNDISSCIHIFPLLEIFEEYAVSQDSLCAHERNKLNQDIENGQFVKQVGLAFKINRNNDTNAITPLLSYSQNCQHNSL